jgi:type I restriction enzyme, S subunit
MNNKTKTTATKEDATPVPVPRLRFPEFRNKAEWHVKKLNDLLFETKTRNRTLELGPADVLSVSGEHGCVNQIEFMGRSYAGVSVKDYHVVEHGDVVYTKSPLKKNPFGIIKENKGKRGIVSTLYAVYRPFPDCSATYLDHFFSGDYNLNAYLQPIVKKGAKNDMKVNNADVLKGNICAPELPEQKKIAECLSSVDELIAAQARKVDALKTHKKCLMQQLFPREGETQPRLRFPEFQNTAEWAVKPLGEVFPITSSKRVHESDWTPAGVPFYRAREIVALNKREPIQPLFISEELYAAHSKQTGEIRDGHLLVTGVGSIGVPYLVRSEDRFYFKDGNILWLKNDGKELIGEFLLRLFEADYVQKQLKMMADVGTVATFTIDNAKRTLAAFPKDKDEQKRIATCLSSLDDLITAETRKNEALKTHKTGLMQQLFPSLEGFKA